MERMGVTRLRTELADTIRRVQEDSERVIVMRHGERAAALISVEDLEWLEELEDRLDDLEADCVEAESAGKPPIPLEQVKAELGL